MGNHRSRLEIIASMLKAINEKASKKTQIMYHANLSYELLLKYLEELSNSSLARFVHGESHYVLTDKGVAFLDQYENYLKQNKNVEKRMSEVNVQKKALEDLCSGS